MTRRTFLLSGVTLERGGRVIVSDVSLEAHPGELIVLRGASGSGKTTILRAMAGLDAFETGTIQVGEARLDGGKAPDAAMLHRLRRSVGFVFQFHCLFEHMTALHNVMLAPVHVYRRSPRDAERRARELLGELGVEARASAFPRQLSGGEAQRVAVAVALANEPDLLLADEVVGQLDTATAADVMDMIITASRERSLTVLYVTHDEQLADRAHRSLRLIDHKVIPA